MKQLQTTGKILMSKLMTMCFFALLLTPLPLLGQSEDALKSNIEQARANGNKSEEAAALVKLGLHYWQNDRLTEAQESFQNALTINKDVNNQNGIHTILVYQTQIYDDMNNPKPALAKIEEAIGIARTKANKKWLATDLLLSASLSHDLGQYQQAIDNAEEAMRFASETNDMNQVKNCLWRLAEAHKALGNQQAYVEYYDKYSAFEKAIAKNDVENLKRLTGATINGLNENLNEKEAEVDQLSDSVKTLDAINKAKELELDLAKAKENQYKLEVEAKQQRVRLLSRTLAFVIVVSVLIAVFLLLLIRLYHQKKKAYHMLETQNQEIASQRDKLHVLNATKDKFFSIIAHDLRNPFNAVMSLLGIMKENFAIMPPDEQREMIHVINDAAKMAANLLENLLEWARAQTGSITPKPISIKADELSAEIIQLMHLNAQHKDIEIKSDVQAGINILADLNMITTVVRNLVNNAVKFTPKGGSVTLSGSLQGDKIHLQVRDTGVGIKSEKLEKLFRIEEAISTPGTDNERGTGLGLIICKEFVELNNGQIFVNSTPGKGTTFTLVLPAA